MDIKQILSYEWYADWSGPFPLLDVSIAPYIYTAGLDMNFGKSLSRFLVVYEKGIATAKLPLDEYNEFGKFIAEKLMYFEYAKKFSNDFKSAADEILPIIKVSPHEFLKNLANTKPYYQKYGAFNVATKIAFNFLPTNESLIKNLLEEARKYSETFYVDNAKIYVQLAKMISDKTKYKEELILMMTHDEMLQYAKNNELPSEQLLIDRFESSGLYWDGKLHMLESVLVQEIEKQWRELVSGKELTGTVAFSGKVIGKCRIIMDFRGASLAEGEILVTGMTNPDFVPLMKNAAAIVTDGGGMLSHAAIVARELKKPCVVGTKNATKVLKNGDLVEVDANEGIIKKLK